MIFFQLPQSLLQLLPLLLGSRSSRYIVSAQCVAERCILNGSDQLGQRPVAKTRSFAFPGDGFEQE
jgi:hypothetical protein